MSYLCIVIRNKTDMNSTYKPKQYEVGCSGSGWGVWNLATNQKVEGFSSCKFGRLQALELMYKLNGWKLPANFK